jgi:hypothetical protein
MPDPAERQSEETGADSEPAVSAEEALDMLPTEEEFEDEF